MKIKITEIHDSDAFYDIRKRYLGKVIEGTLSSVCKWSKNKTFHNHLVDDYSAFTILDSKTKEPKLTFYAAKYAIVKCDKKEYSKIFV